jgi:hypothetical protein
MTSKTESRLKWLRRHTLSSTLCFNMKDRRYSNSKSTTRYRSKFKKTLLASPSVQESGILSAEITSIKIMMVIGHRDCFWPGIQVCLDTN